MYNHRRTMVPRNDSNEQALPQFINSSGFARMQQPPLQPNAIQMCEGFYDGSSFYPTSAPVYQGLAPIQQLQQHYQPPSSGPSRNRGKRWLRKAEPPYPYHHKHGSSGTVLYDRSTGVNPDASNNPGNGEVRRTPSKKPFKLMADCNLTY